MLELLANAGKEAALPRTQLTQGEPEREQTMKRLLARDIVEEVDVEGVPHIRFQIELVRLWWLQAE